jgi:hypothetical protein
MHEIESKNYIGYLDTVWKDLDSISGICLDISDKKKEVREGI